MSLHFKHTLQKLHTPLLLTSPSYFHLYPQVTIQVGTCVHAYTQVQGRLGNVAFILMAMCSDTVAVSVSIDIRGECTSGEHQQFQQAAVHGVSKSPTQLSDFTFTFHFHALEKEMAAHSSVLAWRIPGTGEPGGLPSMGSHRVGHDSSDLAAAAATATRFAIPTQFAVLDRSLLFSSICLSSSFF